MGSHVEKGKQGPHLVRGEEETAKAASAAVLVFIVTRRRNGRKRTTELGQGVWRRDAGIAQEFGHVFPPTCLTLTLSKRKRETDLRVIPGFFFPKKFKREVTMKVYKDAMRGISSVFINDDTVILSLEISGEFQERLFYRGRWEEVADLEKRKRKEGLQIWNNKGNVRGRKDPAMEQKQAVHTECNIRQSGGLY